MIIFLYGEDSFLSRQKLGDYRNRFLKKYGPQGDLTAADAEEKPGVDVAEMTSSRGLFSSVRLVIIKNFISQSGGEKQSQAVSFLKADKDIPLDKDIVLIFWEKNVPKKESALFKFLLKNAKCQEFKRLEGALLFRWMTGCLQEINSEVRLSKVAAEKLAAYSGGNTQLINSELEKLAAFKESGEINESDLDQLVNAKISPTIFEIIEAASGGNKKRALSLLHNQLKNKEDLFYILSMYVYQFRNLLKISEFYWQGMTDRFDIAKKTGLHPYVIQKTLPQLKNFSLEKLKTIYRKLQEIDMEAKTGKVDIALALDKFIVEL